MEVWVAIIPIRKQSPKTEFVKIWKKNLNIWINLELTLIPVASLPPPIPVAV